MDIKRGDVIYLKQTDDPIRMRPYVVVSNDVGNKYSCICLAVPLTSKHKRLDIPTHAIVEYHSSMIMAEQVHTIKKDDIARVAYHLGTKDMGRVTQCLEVSIGGR